MDPRQPDLRLGRAAHLTRSAPEPFYNDDTEQLAAAMHTQRYNGKLATCSSQLLVKNRIRTLTAFLPRDEFFGMHLVSLFGRKLSKYTKFCNSLQRTLNAAQPPSLLSRILCRRCGRKENPDKSLQERVISTLLCFTPGHWLPHWGDLFGTKYIV